MSEMNFEQALAALEAEVRRLEGGSLSLDESLECYEKAIGLVKLCNKRLEDAEQRVMLLTEGDDGVISDTPFGGMDAT